MNLWDDQSPKALFQQSGVAGQRALRSYLDDAPEQFFMYAAVSLELIGKAILASTPRAIN